MVRLVWKGVLGKVNGKDGIRGVEEEEEEEEA